MPKPTAQAAKATTLAKPRELTGKERRTLRALGHSLSPVVQIGKGGLSKGVTKELQGALAAHELIKVQLLGECPLERTEAGSRVCAATGATVVQTLGKMLLFYKPNLEKPKLTLEHPVRDAGEPLGKPKLSRKREPTAPADVTRRSSRASRKQRRDGSGGARSRNRVQK